MLSALQQTGRPTHSAAAVVPSQQQQQQRIRKGAAVARQSAGGHAQPDIASSGGRTVCPSTLQQVFMQQPHSTTAWHTSSYRTLTATGAAAATNSTHAGHAHTTPTYTLLALRPHADEEATDPFAWKIRRGWQASDGTSHIGSSLSNLISNRPFPGGCAQGKASTSSGRVSWCSCCTQQRLE